MQATAVIGD